MSGGNCPETPRQKMIGMMYLMLTAMLALNVSGDLLNAFILVDQSIKDSTKTLEGKNNLLYYNFEAANAQNPKKVGDKYKTALEVKEHADTLFNLIQEYKVLMVQTADGPEATPESYLSTSNQDVAAQVMIVEKQGERGINLRNQIGAYRDYLKNILEDDTMLQRNVETMLKTDDPPMEDGVQVSWQSQNFEHLPLAASMALMSKMQNDVRNTQADVVNYLYGKIDEASFKFNVITPLIIPVSNYVLRGGQYQADIMLAAYDDTMEPEVTVGGQKLPVENGRGKYTAAASSVGNKKYSADITIPDPVTGADRLYKVDGEYEVGEPSVVISPSKMNVFYYGIENPIEVSAAGIPSSDLKITVENAKLEKRGTAFILKPSKNSGKVNINVSADVNGKTQRLGSKEFRIMRVPDPQAQFAGATDGKVAKSLILAQTGVLAKMKDFAFDVKYKVTKFTVSSVKGGFLTSEDSKSSNLTAAQKALLSGLSRGSKFYIENIEAEGPDGKKKLGSLSFTVD